jgi:hypothetical protein
MLKFKARQWFKCSAQPSAEKPVSNTRHYADIGTLLASFALALRHCF